MKGALAALASAFSYFTIFPLGPLRATGAPDAYALSFLPLVGLLVGAIAGLCAQGAMRIADAGTSAFVALALSLVLSGAIHVDGFLDSSDALFSSCSIERRLEIMKDPRHGTFAIVAIVLLAFVWFEALRQLAIGGQLTWLVLAISAAGARLAVLPCAWLFPYARANATPAFLARPNALVVALLFAMIEALAYLVSPWALTIVPLAVLAALAIAWLASRRLGGGLTGDVYGFAIVCVEVVMLVAFARLHVSVSPTT